MTALLKMPCESSAGGYLTITTFKALPVPDLVL
jgi:hypothetical protein